MIEPDGPLSLSRQCVLLRGSRSSIYFRPKGARAENLALMRWMDELHMDYPFYGMSSDDAASAPRGLVSLPKASIGGSAAQVQPQATKRRICSVKESIKPGPQGTSPRVRVAWFPTYSEVRRLLGVWPGRSKPLVTGLQGALERLSGTPDKPVKWRDVDWQAPDPRIEEELTGEELELARAIWIETDKSVNPRHTAGSWSLIRHYALLTEDSDGNLLLTDRGRDFIDHTLGNTEMLLDEREGLLELLTIVADGGPARFGAFVESWGTFLALHSGFGKPSTIKDTLRRRLKNLLDRGLSNRVGLDYAITEAGLGYLKRVDDASLSRGASGVTIAGFARLTQSLRDEGLLFSREVVANYILAQQTKRFAILTGISGTGKTRIAEAVARHFQTVRQETPDGATEVTVTHSHIEHSRLVLPVAMRSQLNISTGSGHTAARKMRVRYPGGYATLSYYWGDKEGKKSERLLFKGDFKIWFESTFKVGDRFWLRARPSATAGPGELEIGPPERLDNYVVVPVRPDWVDNRGLLGYLNPLTNAYSTTPFLNLFLRAHAEVQRAKDAGEKPHPFFVILDEMNLARVEHYFSDFLSALESGEDIPLHENEAIESGEAKSGPRVPRKLKVPGNVLFTGTVNVDETTYMFSPKVLDRAFTIEFDQVDLKGFSEDTSGEDTSALNLDGIQGSLDLLPSNGSEDDNWKPSREDWIEFSEESGKHHKALLRLHDILEAQHRHFGYRVANEIARFVNLAREQAKETDAAVDAAFDLALLQKVLPKFHGTQQELESLLEEIFQFAVHGGGHIPKKDRVVELDNWKVVKGRLVTRSTKPPTPSQTPSGDAGAEGDEADAGTAEAADADNPKTADDDAKSPAYPRTGAKVLRMLNRVRDRGFTSFIE